MRIVTRRLFAFLVLGAVAVLGTGCGGGASDTTPTLPGTLAALALEGAVAPGTGGGTFGAFPATARVSAADGGWTAFVADVVGGTTSKALFVATPGGTVSRVFGVGDAVPAPGSGTINDFTRIFMRPGGIVAALVEITGASGRGVLTAAVSTAGVVSNVARSVYLGEAMPATTLANLNPGNLVTIDDDWLDVDDLGRVFFMGTGSNGLSPMGIWGSTKNGSGREAFAITGDPVNGGGTLGFLLHGFALEKGGGIVAFAADVTGGPALKMLLVRYPNEHRVVAKNGDTPPSTSSRSFDDVFDGGGLVVSFGGGVSTVAWTGSLTGSAPDRVLCFRQISPVVGPNLLTVAACQEPWIPADGASANGIVSGVSLLMGEPNASRLSFFADVSLGTTTKAMMSWGSAVDFGATFGQGAIAPGGSTFTTVYPSLVAPEPYACDNQGSVAFSASLADATSGVFWHIIGTTGELFPFVVVKAGDVAPGTGGGTFGSFGSQSTVVTATAIVVFRATVAGGSAASGLFRQF